MSDYPGLDALAVDGSLSPDAAIELRLALADLTRLRSHVELLVDAGQGVVDVIGGTSGESIGPVVARLGVAVNRARGGRSPR